MIEIYFSEDRVRSSRLRVGSQVPRHARCGDRSGCQRRPITGRGDMPTFIVKQSSQPPSGADRLAGAFRSERAGLICRRRRVPPLRVAGEIVAASSPGAMRFDGVEGQERARPAVAGSSRAEPNKCSEAGIAPSTLRNPRAGSIPSSVLPDAAAPSRASTRPSRTTTGGNRSRQAATAGRDGGALIAGT